MGRKEKRRLQDALDSALPPSEWLRHALVVSDVGASECMRVVGLMEAALEAPCSALLAYEDEETDGRARGSRVLLLTTQLLDEVQARVSRWRIHGAIHVRVLCTYSEEAHASTMLSKYEEDVYASFSKEAEAWNALEENEARATPCVEVRHWNMHACLVGDGTDATPLSYHLPLRCACNSLQQEQEKASKDSYASKKEMDAWKDGLRRSIRQLVETKREGLVSHVEGAPFESEGWLPYFVSMRSMARDEAKDDLQAHEIEGIVSQLGGRLSSACAIGPRSMDIAKRLSRVPCTREHGDRTTLLLFDRSLDLLSALRSDVELRKEEFLRLEGVGIVPTRLRCGWTSSVDDRLMKEQVALERAMLASASRGDFEGALRRACSAWEGKLSLARCSSLVGLAYACAGSCRVEELVPGASPFQAEEESKLRRVMRQRLMRDKEEASMQPWLEDVIHMDEDGIRQKAALDERVETVLEKLRMIAYVSYRERKEGRIGGTVFPSIVDAFLKGEDVPGMVHIPSSLGALVRTGLGVFGIQQAHPNRNPLVVVFVVGGITQEEIRNVSDIAKRHDREVIVGGSYEIDAVDAFRGLLANADGYS